MATNKIKYSELATAPSKLEEGQLSYANKSGKLFIGTEKGTKIDEIVGGTGESLDFTGDNIVDYVSDLELYRGEAVVGSAHSASVWRIRHIVINSDASASTTTWASGTSDFDKSWNNRLSYTYSGL